MLEEDKIENIIGRFGKYQRWIFVLLTISRLPTDYQLVNVVFLLPNVQYTCLDEEAYNQTNYCPCKNPQYDLSDIGNSVTSTFGLICEKRHLASLGQSILQAGILVGGIFYGYLSDRYGRRTAVFLALFCEVLFVSLSAATTQFWMFVVMRFLIGTAVGGTMLCAYIMLVELSGKSFRPYLAGMIDISLIISYFTLPILAYYLRDWRKLQLTVSLPWLYVAVIYFVLPESPRWLITTGQKDKAVEVLSSIAKRNNRPTENIRVAVENLVYEEEISNRQQQHGTYLDLFRTPKVRAYTFITAFIWLSISHTFFGINQYIGRLEGNIYINVIFSSIGLIPGMTLVVIASLYLNRRLAVVISCGVAAISLIVFIFIPSNMNNLILVFAVIGQTGAFTAFAQIYLYSSEIFPTIIRNSAMGFASMFARFGGFIAPFVVNIGIEWVSIVIFSLLVTFAGISCYFLPETKGTVLLNTIDETENSVKKLTDDVN
ncbi:unnamed protein product [Danaus chrysippus]|uniref:(African queen) hypothetical protein n=1 Tax=Danaus chrysippus TaxID=151541 RepID=A0A8J2QIS4_9NEOP|nr:unnamed protein product [Danaus chrysippus]